ncbi:MAG: GH32 C-terminal domain-containing protein [Mycoplasmataceae bacterium]|nr:GH32 C-terminal domain-containing protein [Mycoplasmataceae bacterium]
MKNYTRKEKYINLKDNKDFDFNELRKKIVSDQNYPNFHITAPTGLINDPNALYFDKEYHNINFQWFPFFGHHGLKHWGNIKTKDFVNFESNFDDVVYPSTKFDNGGIYSGGAIKDSAGEIHRFYTGNIVNEKLEGYTSSTVHLDNKGNKKLLFMTDDKKYTRHFRDPKPFEKFGKKFLLNGAQNHSEKGVFSVYEGTNWNSEFSFYGEIKFSKEVDTGYMIECPDILSFKDRDVIIASIEGVESKYLPRTVKYMTGSLDKDLNFEIIDDFKEMDHGFDFYAPQSYKFGNKNYMLAWVGNSGKYEFDSYKGWHSMLTFPRELDFVNGTLYNKPAKELNNLIKKEISMSKANPRKHGVLLEGNSADEITLTDEQGNSITIDINDSYFSVDLEKSLINKRAFPEGNFPNKKKILISKLTNFIILLDTSILEIFINDGEHSFTSRFFLDGNINVTSKSKNTLAKELKDIVVKGGYYGK